MSANTHTRFAGFDSIEAFAKAEGTTLEVALDMGVSQDEDGTIVVPGDWPNRCSNGCVCTRNASALNDRLQDTIYERAEADEVIRELCELMDLDELERYVSEREE